jgi:hypothetical protein
MEEICSSEKLVNFYRAIIVSTHEITVCRLLIGVFYLNYTSTLKMEAIRSSETSVGFYRTTRHNKVEDHTLYTCVTLYTVLCPAYIMSQPCKEACDFLLQKYFACLQLENGVQIQSCLILLARISKKGGYENTGGWEPS